jgi:hypothetical protein
MKYLSLFVFLATQTACIASNPSSLLPGNFEAPQINYHNRPLIKVNGKTISLVDVIKKMDFQMLQHAPSFLNETESRCQYYSSNWRKTFQELVEQELVLLDAEPLKIAVSEADIREELERVIGNNLIIKLDEIGLTLEEAKKMTENDMIVRQMLWYKAYSKALQSVTPELIKTAYSDITKQDLLKQKEQWCYQVLTIKSKDTSKGEKAANEAFELLNKPNSIMASVPNALKSELKQLDGIEYTVSKDLVVDSQSISKSHFEVLSHLKENEFSKPILQTTKNNQESVHRIFHLKEHHVEKTKPFEQMATSIKDKLTQISAEKEKKDYIDALKGKFMIYESEIQDVMPKDYEPFALL